VTTATRLRQGVRALLAFSQPVDLDLAAQYLAPDLLALFRQMQRSEQLHSLNVLRSVLAQGTTPRDLAVAALLHDVGKARYPLRVWQKTLVVLVRAGFPAVFERWSHGSLDSLIQRPFVVYAEHPAWSAELIAAAGASPASRWLVQHHADRLTEMNDPLYSEWLLRLQQADDAH
jgi:hypothetical protein